MPLKPTQRIGWSMPRLDLTKATEIKGFWGNTNAIKGPGFVWAKPVSVQYWNLNRQIMGNTGFGNLVVTETSLTANMTTIRNNISWAADLPKRSRVEYDFTVQTGFLQLRGGNMVNVSEGSNVLYNQTTTGGHVSVVINDVRPFIGFFTYYRGAITITNFKVTPPFQT